MCSDAGAKQEGMDSTEGVAAIVVCKHHGEQQTKKSNRSKADREEVEGGRL